MLLSRFGIAQRWIDSGAAAVNDDTFSTQKHREYVNITDRVEAVLRKSAIQEGMILVSAMHITAGVWVNDAEDGLLADIDEWLEKLAPFRADYRHHRTGETNGDSHLKSCWCITR